MIEVLNPDIKVNIGLTGLTFDGTAYHTNSFEVNGGYEYNKLFIADASDNISIKLNGEPIKATIEKVTHTKDSLKMQCRRSGYSFDIGTYTLFDLMSDGYFSLTPATVQSISNSFKQQLRYSSWNFRVTTVESAIAPNTIDTLFFFCVGDYPCNDSYKGETNSWAILEAPMRNTTKTIERYVDDQYGVVPSLNISESQAKLGIWNVYDLMLCIPAVSVMNAIIAKLAPGTRFNMSSVNSGLMIGLLKPADSSSTTLSYRDYLNRVTVKDFLENVAPLLGVCWTDNATTVTEDGVSGSYVFSMLYRNSPSAFSEWKIKSDNITTYFDTVKGVSYNDGGYFEDKQNYTNTNVNYKAYIADEYKEFNVNPCFYYTDKNEYFLGRQGNTYNNIYELPHIERDKINIGYVTPYRPTTSAGYYTGSWTIGLNASSNVSVRSNSLELTSVEDLRNIWTLTNTFLTNSYNSNLVTWKPTNLSTYRGILKCSNDQVRLFNSPYTTFSTDCLNAYTNIPGYNSDCTIELELMMPRSKVELLLGRPFDFYGIYLYCIGLSGFNEYSRTCKAKFIKLNYSY